MLSSVQPRLRAASFLLAAVALLATAAPVSATSTPYDHNIVKNPSAEAGGSAHTCGSGDPTVVAIPNWVAATASSHMTVVKYGAGCGYPTVAQGQAFGGNTQ